MGHAVTRESGDVFAVMMVIDISGRVRGAGGGGINANQNGTSVSQNM